METVRILSKNFLGYPLALTGGLVILGALSHWIAAPGWKDHRPEKRDLLLPILLIIFPVGLIVILTLLNDNLKLLTDRNLSIILPALALLAGIGITAFDRFGQVALVIVLLVNGLFTTHSYHQKPPWREMAAYVADRQVDNQPIILDVGGDVQALAYHVEQETATPQIQIYMLEQDPSIEMFSYLRFVALNDVSGFWVISWGGKYYEGLEGWGYVRTAAGVDYHQGSRLDMYRYDSIQLLDQKLATFGDQITLHQAETPDQAASGDQIGVGLWWSVPQKLDRDYTVSVFVLNAAEQIVAQDDKYPQQGQTPTSTLAPDQLIFDWHPLELPKNLSSGEYQVGVKVYWLVDGSILRTDSDKEYFEIEQIEIGG